jgi:MFS transporter, MCT family, aspergillic acid transporter
MASMDGTKFSPLARDSQADPDPEKAGQAESDRSGEMEQSPEESRDKLVDDATKVGDSGQLDGGAAAWLNVLGAWCCSFSSPGWCNSTYFPYLQLLSRGHPIE